MQTNLVASWIIHQLVCAGVQRLTGVYWVQNHFVSNHHLHSHEEKKRRKRNEAELAHLELPKMQTTGRMMRDSFYFKPGICPRTFAPPKRPRPASLGIPGPSRLPHPNSVSCSSSAWLKEASNADSLASGRPVANSATASGKASDAALSHHPHLLHHS